MSINWYFLSGDTDCVWTDITSFGSWFLTVGRLGFGKTIYRSCRWDLSGGVDQFLVGKLLRAVIKASEMVVITASEMVVIKASQMVVIRSRQKQFTADKWDLSCL